MEYGMLQLCLVAREQMRQYGITITGAHWYVPKQGQRKRNALYVCLEGITRNSGFFGYPYENWRRIRLLDLAYDAVFSLLKGGLDIDELAIDVRLSLSNNACLAEPVFKPQTSIHGHVNVAVDSDVRLVNITDALLKGDVEPGTMMDEYCRRYNLPKILLHGKHYISPDSASVDFLENAINFCGVQSVLEIGAGVGICGVAAERHDLIDYTFVDSSPKVCGYLKERFPQFNVYYYDAMTFPLKRDYDLILVGTPYELNPFLLQKRGAQLANSCGLIMFQSGCRNFFQFEHDWIMGRQDERWPWYQSEQSLLAHFPYQFELSIDWQLAAVGCHNFTQYNTLRNYQESIGWIHQEENQLVI